MNRKKSSASTTKDLALSGLLSALCFVLMYICAATEIFDLCAVIVSSAIIVVSMIEAKGFWPWLIWLVTGTLCLLLIPRIDIALEFVLFGGVYPMIKAFIEKLPKVPAWALKLVFFNTVFTGWYYLSKLLFACDPGFDFGVVAYLAANVFFVLSDVFLSVAAVTYVNKLRPRLGIGKRK